jgi:hypothetical protein
MKELVFEITQEADGALRTCPIIADFDRQTESDFDLDGNAIIASELFELPASHYL